MIRANRRFYQQVTFGDAEAGGYRILLDDRPARTPLGNELTLRSESLARKIAAEWEAQADEIDPEAMPLTGLAVAAIDHVAAERPGMTRALVQFLATDTVCFRTEEPRALAARQRRLWDPLLDQFAEDPGIRITPTTGLQPLSVSDEDRRILTGALDAASLFSFTAINRLAGLTGSIVVACALWRGVIDAGKAFETGLLEELWQADKWGADAEAEAARARLRRDMDAAECFIRLSL